MCKNRLGKIYRREGSLSRERDDISEIREGRAGYTHAKKARERRENQPCLRCVQNVAAMSENGRRRMRPRRREAPPAWIKRRR